MNVEFVEECNYLGEACTLLSIYYQKESFSELQESLKKKSGYRKELDHILHVMTKVYDEILQQIKLPDELSVYFDYFDDDIRAVGLAFCMLHEGICAEGIAWENLTDYMKERFHTNQASFISAVLDYDLVGEAHQEILFLKELEKMQAPDNVKWTIWRVYTDFDTHLDKLMEVILKMMPIIKSCYEKYAKEFTSFNDYWKDACDSGTFCEKLKRATKIDIQDGNHVVVHPCWMGCNSVRMIAAGTDLSNLQLLLGLFFCEKEFVDDCHFTREDITLRLKLLSDASKYEIMKLIKNQSLYGSQLADKLSLSTATISHHVNGLASAGLINITKDSNRVYYQLNKVQVGFLLNQIKQDLYED